MTRVERPFGQPQGQFLRMDDATRNPMAVPVLAAAGDVVIFSEGMTHNAYPTNRSIRRSVFFNYMPDRAQQPALPASNSR